MRRSKARKLGDGCGWVRRLASVGLQVTGGWVVGRGRRLGLRWLGGEWPSWQSWNVGCWGSIVMSIGGAEEVGLLGGMVAMLADMSAIAFDMSAIASSRRSVAWKTRVNDSRSHGVRIVGQYGVRGRSRERRRSRVGWGWVVMSFGGVFVALSSSSMVVRSGGVIGVGEVVVVASSLSSTGIVGVGVVVISGVGSSLVLGFIASLIGGMQRAGVSLHVGGTTWQRSASMIVVVVVGVGVMVSSLLREG